MMAAFKIFINQYVGESCLKAINSYKLYQIRTYSAIALGFYPAPNFLEFEIYRIDSTITQLKFRQLRRCLNNGSLKIGTDLG